MLKYVNHVVYVVHNRDAMVEYLEKTFGMKPQKVFDNLKGKAKQANYTIGKTQIQIAEPFLDPTSAIRQHLVTHGPGVWHVAWEIDNILKVARELAAKGEVQKNSGTEGIKESANGYLTCDIDPASAHGVWFQLTGIK
jgi:catechol 2,3-dioxygenase-like lactoylglutathione lyase family enzyme